MVRGIHMLERRFNGSESVFAIKEDLVVARKMRSKLSRTRKRSRRMRVFHTKTTGPVSIEFLLLAIHIDRSHHLLRKLEVEPRTPGTHIRSKRHTTRRIIDNLLGKHHIGTSHSKSNLRHQPIQTASDSDTVKPNMITDKIQRETPRSKLLNVSHESTVKFTAFKLGIGGWHIGTICRIASVNITRPCVHNASLLHKLI
ncbi:hypothetical protein EBT31_14490 [bacterium]|nr:hypothetical protein [bacterium]